MHSENLCHFAGDTKGSIDIEQRQFDRVVLLFLTFPPRSLQAPFADEITRASPPSGLQNTPITVAGTDRVIDTLANPSPFLV